MVPGSPLERLRRIWSPNKEIVELVQALEPQTELDSMIRDILHRTIQQRGPVTLVLHDGTNPVMNVGTLRWEVVHHEPMQGTMGRREISCWVEA